MELLFHKILLDPPPKYIQERKKVKLDEAGQVVPEKVHYLTANLFYADKMHWAVKQKIVDFAKQWLYDRLLGEVPKILQCRLEITYLHPNDTFDVDNKVFFWTKLLLDMLKTPTSKQILRAEKYNSKIFNLDALPDDKARFVKGINMMYDKGQCQIDIKIFGILMDEQKRLFE